MPYVFEVRDIWPEFAVSIGVLKNPLVIKAAYFAERLFYRHAARVQAISDGMRQILVDRGLEAEKLTMIPTGVDVSLYEGVTPDDSARRQFGFDGRVLAVYAGAHSDANGLEYVIEAAEALKDDPRVGILMIGEGRRKDDLVAMAAERGLTNVGFLPKIPKRRLIRILIDADVGMVILKPLPEFVIAMPNKLFDYMAAGTAVVVNFDGDAARELRQAGGGLATAPNDPGALAAALKAWADRPEQLQAAKQAARQLVRRYDRRNWTRELAKVLAGAAATGRH